jgi:hypothetical protein
MLLVASHCVSDVGITGLLGTKLASYGAQSDLAYTLCPMRRNGMASDGQDAVIRAPSSALWLLLPEREVRAAAIALVMPPPGS